MPGGGPCIWRGLGPDAVTLRSAKSEESLTSQTSTAGLAPRTRLRRPRSVSEALSAPLDALSSRTPITTAGPPQNNAPSITCYTPNSSNFPHFSLPPNTL
ncbi:rho GTPase-activating protein 33-like [Alligator mississippiensis]|uniref:Rho GTPase-activating protein 33-like n=1 Tax=Alligator mississippiensis TaxID=8496 RepID=A0A151P5N4_ALLMI|nr:rho GTPase-activating protein 33-like [Alligator mississippiensis]